MKITNVAVLFVLGILPFFLMQHLDVRFLHEAKKSETMYDAYLSAAVLDAAHTISGFDIPDGDLHIPETGFSMNLEEVSRVFSTSLTKNFGVYGDEYSERQLLLHAPALVVIGYDGFWVWAMDEYADASGSMHISHVWRPRMPYAYADPSGGSISFFLDGYMHVLSPSGTWLEGKFTENSLCTQVPAFSFCQNPEATLEDIFRQTVVNSVRDSLEYHINRHAQFVSRLGYKYTFLFPYMDGDDWANTISDVGVLAFLQGLPLGTREYNNFAFAGAKIAKRSPVIGTTRNSDGRRFFFDARCQIPPGYTRVEIFQSGFDAAKAGYFQMDCKNPGTV